MRETSQKHCNAYASRSCKCYHKFNSHKIYYGYALTLGNLWREFWDTSKPVPAVKQVPLFDEDLAV